jgi:hypothetical protein
MDLFVARRSDAPRYVMVGRAADVAKRMRELQRGHVFTAAALAIFPNQGPLELEVHKRLKWCRVNREWFECDLQTVVLTIASLLSTPPAATDEASNYDSSDSDDGGPKRVCPHGYALP